MSTFAFLLAADGGEMGGGAAIALLQQVAWRLGHGEGDDPGDKLVMLGVARQ